MRSARLITLLVVALPLGSLSGQENKATKPIEIDPALSGEYYKICMERYQDEKQCKAEASDPELVKYYGKLDGTGKLVPVTAEDRAAAFAHCMAPYGDTSDPPGTPELIKSIGERLKSEEEAECRKTVEDHDYVYLFLTNPMRKVRKVYVEKFHGSKKIEEALRATCIAVADSAEHADATLATASHEMHYQPDQEYNTTCSSTMHSSHCSDGVTTTSTECGPFGDCVSTTHHNTYATLILFKSKPFEELDWVEPVSWKHPSEIAKSISTAAGCTVQ